MSTIKPIDSGILQRAALETGCFVTAEDHNMFGGLGSAVAEVLARSLPCPIETIAVTDRFGQSGEPEELAERYGLTAPFIAAAARRAIARKSSLRR
jgi:transketolase